MATAGAVFGASFSASSAAGGLRYEHHHLAAFPDLLQLKRTGRNIVNRSAVIRLPVLSSLACGWSDSVLTVSRQQRARRRIVAAVGQEEAVETAAEPKEAVDSAVESAAEAEEVVDSAVETAVEAEEVVDSAVETAAEAEEAVDAAVETAAEAVEGEEGAQEEEEAGDDQLNDNSTKLYFGNLPYHCDSAQLAGIVQQYGNPELVEVLYNRETGKSRGFGFVTMSTVDDANAVIENLDGSEFAGRLLRVNFADKPRPKEPQPETEHKLFVGNLSWSATSDSLYEIFKQCGNVVGARVLYDGDSGKSRGYGFVCYATRSEMEAALATLDGVELEGRPMRVAVAQGKRY